MTNKEECKIIQDLLPNYIENLTSEETKQYINKHLENCNECKSVFESMQSNLVTNIETRDVEVDFLKKIRKKMCILIFLLLLVIFIICFWYLRKFYIISNISSQINTLKQTTNYYAKVTSVENDTLHIVESFVKDSEVLTNFKVVSESYNLNTSMYKNLNDDVSIFISHNEKTINNIDDSDVFKVDVINYANSFADLNFFQRLFYVRNIKSITSTECDGSNCYLIDFYNGLQLWIDKSTGLTLRVVDSDSEESSRIYEYEYNLNSLIEIELIDIDEYTFINN